MTNKTIPNRRARVKLDLAEPSAWKLATAVLLHIANHPGPPLERSDLKFLLRIAIEITRKQRSQLEEIAAIIGEQI